MFKGIIFDLDGTLLDTRNDMGNSVNYVLQQRGLKTHSLEKYNQFVGNGIPKLIERSFPKGYDDLESAFDDFMVYYGNHCTDYTLHYEGIVSLLKILNALNIPIAISTNKVQSLTDTMVAHYFKDIQFVDVIGDRLDGLNKPNAHYPNLILDKMNLNHDEVLFVGDSNVDIQTAKNANLTSVGIAWGFRGEVELIESGADYIAQTAEDILSLVRPQSLVLK